MYIGALNAASLSASFAVPNAASLSASFAVPNAASLSASFAVPNAASLSASFAVPNAASLSASFAVPNAAEEEDIFGPRRYFPRLAQFTAIPSVLPHKPGGTHWVINIRIINK